MCFANDFFTEMSFHVFQAQVFNIKEVASETFLEQSIIGHREDQEEAVTVTPQADATAPPLSLEETETAHAMAGAPLVSETEYAAPKVYVSESAPPMVLGGRQQESSAIPQQPAYVQERSPLAEIRPLTIEQLNSLYYNARLENNQAYIDKFIQVRYQYAKSLKYFASFMQFLSTNITNMDMGMFN